MNKLLFNEDTVDQVLQYLMTKGIRVAGGEFVNLVIDYLTEHGTIDPGRVYESPFTDVAPQGPNAIFPAPDLDEFFNIVQHLHDTAAE